MSSRKRGSVLAMFVAGLVCLVAMLALTIDVGFWYHRRAQIQMVGDVAALSALGSNDQTLSIDAQKSRVTEFAKAVVNNNGLPWTNWGINLQTTTSSGVTFVSTVTLTHTTGLPTFFWSIFGPSSPVLVTVASAENTLTQKTYPPCGFIALNEAGVVSKGGSKTAPAFDFKGGGNGVYDGWNSLDVDSSQRLYDISDHSSPFAYDLANQGVCGNGDITGVGNIKLAGSALASGNAAIAGTILGPVISNGPEFFFEGMYVPPAVTAAINGAGYTNPGSYGASTVAAQSKTLIPGSTYYFTDISDGIKLSSCDPTRPVSVYFNGEVNQGGGIEINADAKSDAYICPPTCLTIYGVKPGGGTICVKGGQGVISANLVMPTYDFDLRGNMTFFGAVLCDTMSNRGTVTTHYDAALGYRFVYQPPQKSRVHLVR